MHWKDTTALVVMAWLSGASRIDTNATTPVDITFPAARFTDQVYALPLSFKQILIYDSPSLIAEKYAPSLDSTHAGPGAGRFGHY